MGLFSLQDKNILITGGYGYLGQAICQGLLVHGAKVWVLGRSEDKFEKTFEQEEKIFFEQTDIADTQSIRQSFENIAKQNLIDVLINNAFYSQGQHPETMTDDDWAMA
ncbi:oxidoreductase [Microscilla marina ATCC 23134]|uniref:Oxidoreductase n=1 Tax=Microscilla marina ATCC 23134 TaxID=313606 RepID=A1ZCJ5_MICM2|nr:oxidoreductase [Microscilla marina ATCC 23134]